MYRVATVPGAIEYYNEFPQQFFVFEFLKQFLSKDSVPWILIALNYQSSSNDSNFACWNGLHPV